MADTVTLTIDDRPVTVPAGTLVVDAARALGIQIPVFCSHPRLDPVGVCRMCMVEYVTPRGSRVDVSCTVPVTEGMVVRTETPPVKAAREAILGFLLINHPLDCPICDKGGECPLQDQTLQYGSGTSKFVEEKNHKAKRYPVSDLIMLDQERCVLCWRCIRYLDEWEDKPQLQLHNRGDRTIIDVFPGRPLDAKTSGSIIDICPVGALTDRTARFGYRPWELTKTPSVCTLCPVGCNLRLDERVHELRRIVARANPAVNDEWICDKGRFMRDYVDHADRLRTPLVREDGALRPATWDEALQRVVDRLSDVVEAHGAQAAGGIAAARVSNEAAFLFQKFFRTLIGNNNVDFATGSAVRALPGGLSAIADLAHADLFVLVGIDPDEAAPVLNLWLKRAISRRGAKVIVIHPRRIDLARYPGAYLPVLPGADAIALNGLAASLLAQREAAARKPTAGRQSAGASANDEWTWVRGYTPEECRRAAGTPPDAMSAAVQLLTKADHPLFLYGPGAATGERGQSMLAALSNLAALLGHGDRLAYVPTEANSQGARDMGLLPDALPGHLPLTDNGLRDRLAKLWGVHPPPGAGLSYNQMITGGVRALLVMGADPAVDPVAAQQLRGLDFLAVQDLFLTETAKLADVVLPTTSFAEADGTYTNLERRVQRACQGIRAVGEGRADWQILADLGCCWQAACEDRKLPVAEAPVDGAQADWKRKRKAQAQRQSPLAKPWNYTSLGAVLEEIGRVAPFYSGMHWDALGSTGLQWPASAAARVVRRVEPAHVAPLPPLDDGSLWLASGPVLWDAGALAQHSHPLAEQRIPEPFVALNPADLERAGQVAGKPVSITSARSTVTLILRADPAVQPGTAWVPFGLAGAPAETLGAGANEPVAVRIG